MLEVNRIDLSVGACFALPFRGGPFSIDGLQRTPIILP